MPRVLRFLVHNWPLKLAAVALSTLLYGGLVLSQSSQAFTTPIPIQYANSTADVVVLSNPGSVTRIRYVAPPDLGFRVDSTTFAATIDVGKVDPTGVPVLVPVTVTTIDPRVQIIDFEPRSVPVTVDR